MPCTGTSCSAANGPLADEVVAAMRVKPNILKRRAAIERVLQGIEELISTFDEGVGDMGDETDER